MKRFASLFHYSNGSWQEILGVLIVVFLVFAHLVLSEAWAVEIVATMQPSTIQAFVAIPEW